MALSVDADDEHLTGGVDDVGVQGVELFDLHDAGDLVMSRSISRKLPPVIRMMALKVSTSLASPGSSSKPELVPVVRQDERKVLGVQRLVLVREATGR